MAGRFSTMPGREKPVAEFFVIVKVVIADFRRAGVFGFADEIEARFFGQHFAQRQTRIITWRFLKSSSEISDLKKIIRAELFVFL